MRSPPIPPHFGLFLALLASSSGSAREPVLPLLERSVDGERVERVLRSLSFRERAAQLVLAYPQLDGKGPVEVGGVLFVGRTLHDLDKARQRIQSSRARARVPPFFAVDMEGGPFNRMKTHPAVRALPSARKLGTSTDAEVEAWGYRVGTAMRELGLNMNLAPVLDVAGKGHMRHNGRAFGGDPERVVQKASAYARGLLRAGVVPIGKHFPGYGELESDSDHELAVAPWPADEIERQMEVFHRAGPLLGGVMMSNVVYTAFGREPAILNPALVARAHQRGWLTLTDDVSVAALREAVGGDAAEVLRRAFLAGNDLVLTTAPPDWSKGIDPIGVLVRLAEEDPTLRARVDDACRRILQLKDRMGLLEGL